MARSPPAGGPLGIPGGSWEKFSCPSKSPSGVWEWSHPPLSLLVVFTRTYLAHPHDVHGSSPKDRRAAVNSFSHFKTTRHSGYISEKTETPALVEWTLWPGTETVARKAHHAKRTLPE